MRILHLTTSFPASKKDAAGAFIHRLTSALGQKGIECRILTPATTHPSTWPEHATVYRFRYAPWKIQTLAQLPGGIPAALKKNILHFALLPCFLCAMGVSLAYRARHCDLIHAHWSICGAIAVITKIFHHKPVIITIHGSDQHKSQKNLIYSVFHHLAVKGAAVTVCVSSDILSELQQQIPSHASRFRFIANGVADSFFKVSSLPYNDKEPLQLVTIGSLIPLKGVDTIIESLAQLPPSISWKLTIVGEGKERHNLQKLAAQYNLLQHITFTGTIAPDSIPQIMAKHHVLILASHREGRPSVILEAMAAAKAIIATNVHGTRELVKNDTTGWLFEPDDANALSAIIESIANKEKNIMKTGIAGRKWVENENLTWSATAYQYQQLYREVIQSRS